MSQNLTDMELVAGCLRDDRRFQELLYNKYSRTMYAVCLSYAKDRDSAQDILQDGFIKVFEKINTFNNQCPVEAWIRKIISNTAVDYYRKKSTLRKFIEFDHSPLEKIASENVLDMMQADEIILQLRKLPAGAQVVFNLYALEGFSHKEIAEKLQISEGTSKSQFSRAKDLLQKLLYDLRF